MSHAYHAPVPENSSRQAPSSRRRWVRRLALAGGIVLISAAALYTARSSILTAIGAALIYEDPLEPADIVFLLNGDANTKPVHAANLIRRGLAPSVVIARNESSPTVKMGLTRNVTDVSIGVLVSSGVEASKIIQIAVDGGVTSTYDEARELVGYCRQHPAVKRVLVVTTEFHSRRTRWMMKKAFRDVPVEVLISPTPDLRFTAGNWWKREEGFLSCFNEYLKLAFYLVNY